jgi:hypothetical protein
LPSTDCGAGVVAATRGAGSTFLLVAGAGSRLAGNGFFTVSRCRALLTRMRETAATSATVEALESRARKWRFGPRASTRGASSACTVSTTLAATTLSGSWMAWTLTGANGRTTAGDKAAVAVGAILLRTTRGAAGVMATVKAR